MGTLGQSFEGGVYSVSGGGRPAMKCFGRFMHKAPEFSATGLSPCCLPGNGGGALVRKSFAQGFSSSAMFRSCSAIEGAWAAFL